LTLLDCFAPCPRGLEKTLADELLSLGATVDQVVTAGVAFRGDRSVAYAANLHSRIASRILLRVAQGRYRDDDDLYRLANRCEWERWFDVHRTLRIDVNAIRSPLRSLNFATLRLKDGLVDRFRTRTGVRPSIDTVTPDVRIFGFLDERGATLYLDLSGEPLFKRGWRTEREDKGEAPLKENLAAGLRLRDDPHRSGKDRARHRAGHRTRIRVRATAGLRLGLLVAAARGGDPSRTGDRRIRLQPPDRGQRHRRAGDRTGQAQRRAGRRPARRADPAMLRRPGRAGALPRARPRGHQSALRGAAGVARHGTIRAFRTSDRATRRQLRGFEDRQSRRGRRGLAQHRTGREGALRRLEPLDAHQRPHAAEASRDEGTPQNPAVQRGARVPPVRIRDLRRGAAVTRPG
jgi:hypothetical protein